MAPRKTSTRKKRPARGKKSGQSAMPVITLGGILLLGAAALWATAQNKRPSTSVSSLLQDTLGTTVSRPAAPVRSHEERAATVQHRPRETVKIIAPVTEPAITPPAPLRKPVPQNSRPAAPVQSIPAQIAAIPVPRLAPKPAIPAAHIQKNTPALPPVGRTAPDDYSRNASGAFKTPKAIIARQALTIREKAWDKAKPVGKVEQGREMRSYAKVGRWHRVVVPSTNIIGWVREDQLTYKTSGRRTASSRPARAPQAQIITGSIRPAQAEKAKNTGLVAPVYPQRPVGQ